MKSQKSKAHATCKKHYRFIFIEVCHVACTTLPARFLYAGHIPFVCKLTKTNPAKVKISHITTLTAASKTTPHYAGCKLRLLLCSRYNRNLRHGVGTVYLLLRCEVKPKTWSSLKFPAHLLFLTLFLQRKTKLAEKFYCFFPRFSVCNNSYLEAKNFGNILTNRLGKNNVFPYAKV